MTCVVDFDGTFLRNDFFKELFFAKIIENPFYIINELIIKRKKLIDIKNILFKNYEINYSINSIINHDLHDWLIKNKLKYSKIIIVSATPDFFIKYLLSNFKIFDELYGSIDSNLKGEIKLNFIKNMCGENFDYIGNSKDDYIIFKHAKNSFLVKNNSIIKFK